MIGNYTPLLLCIWTSIRLGGTVGSAQGATIMADVQAEYRYNRLTWEEINQAVAQRPVVILPTGSTEQHGRHLPLDVDVFLCEQVCLEARRRAAGRVLILPPLGYGLNLHHIDFPGTIHIEPEV